LQQCLGRLHWTGLQQTLKFKEEILMSVFCDGIKNME
jgi:hypothetical protein